MNKKKKNGKKVLVVEDDSLLAKVLVEKLTKEGFETLNVKNGLEVQEKARTFGPDIALLDLILPGIDGVTALKGLKKNKKTSSIPVVLLTNLTDSDKEKVARDLGVTDYMVKAECKINDVVKKVKSKLK